MTFLVDAYNEYEDRFSPPRSPARPLLSPDLVAGPPLGVDLDGDALDEHIAWIATDFAWQILILADADGGGGLRYSKSPPAFPRSRHKSGESEYLHASSR